MRAPDIDGVYQGQVGVPKFKIEIFRKGENKPEYITQLNGTKEQASDEAKRWRQELQENEKRAYVYKVTEVEKFIVINPEKDLSHY